MSKHHQIDVEWDEVKNLYNQRAHDISFEEAATVFYDSLEITLNDTDHSSSEYRFLIIGESDAGRSMVVSYTERAGKIRLISARKPTRNERKDYQEN